jgi:hypothetical protein
LDSSDIPEHTKAGLAAMNANAPLAHIKDKAEFANNIISKYLDGLELTDQAKEYGVTNKRLYQILIDSAPETWKSAQAAKAFDHYENAEKQLREAKDGLELARARELVRSAQWQLERVLSRIYGQKQEVAPSSAIQINIGITRSGEIDVTP